MRKEFVCSWRVNFGTLVVRLWVLILIHNLDSDGVRIAVKHGIRDQGLRQGKRGNQHELIFVVERFAALRVEVGIKDVSTRQRNRGSGSQPDLELRGSVDRHVASIHVLIRSVDSIPWQVSNSRGSFAISSRRMWPSFIHICWTRSASKFWKLQIGS